MMILAVLELGLKACDTTPGQTIFFPLWSKMFNPQLVEFKDLETTDKAG